METNILIALKKIAESPGFDLNDFTRYRNRVNSMGDPLEKFVKDAFCGVETDDSETEAQEKHSHFFSYLGNQNNPPDAIIKRGDAIEIKKVETNPNDLALNSSYPKNKLYSDCTKINNACRTCESWSVKDIIYTIGVVSGSRLKTLCFAYGDCFAASRDVYERIENAVASGVKKIPDIEFSETRELGRVNKVDPLGITSLRIRGMWSIKNPIKIFQDFGSIVPGKDFSLFAVMLADKYNSFPSVDKNSLEKTSGIKVESIRIKSPDNPAKMLDAKIIKFSK